MKISLFQSILFGAFGVSALIGLFIFATYTSHSTNNTVGNVVIWGTLPKSGMDAVLTSATKSNTAFKNISYVQKDPETLSTDLATAIATGNAPDLILSSQEDLLSLKKFIVPIPFSSLSVHTFQSSFVGEGNLFTIPGGAGYYGIPFLVDPLVLFSNRSILSSDGIASPPSTWEALTGLVPQVALLTPTQQVTRGLIALGTYDNVHDARGILSALFLQEGVPISSYTGNDILSANLGQANSSTVPPGQAVLGFYTQFADPSKVSYTWNPSLPDSQQAFLSGDLALYLGFASEARFLSAANPNLDFNVTPLPQPATAPVKSAYGLVYAFMIPRGAKNPAGAYQAALLLTSTPGQNVAAAATGLAPATLSALATIPSNDPVAAVSYAEALYANGWLSPTPGDTDRVFSSMIGSVISGGSTLNVALISAENALNPLLR